MYSLVTPLCPTLCNPIDCSPSGSSVHGISQLRILEWVAMPFSKGDLSDPGIDPHSLMSPALAGRFFTTSTTWEEGPESWSNITSECVCEGVSKKRLAFDSVA